MTLQLIVTDVFIITCMHALLTRHLVLNSRASILVVCLFFVITARFCHPKLVYSIVCYDSW